MAGEWNCKARQPENDKKKIEVDQINYQLVFSDLITFTFGLETLSN